LQITQLLSLERESDIRNRLGKLPKGLTASYNEIYTSIQTQEGSKPDIANRVFQWITASVEPLHADALVAAVCQDADNDEPQPVDIDIEFVLGACRNLVVVNQFSICQFSHLSVQEYFEDQHRGLVDQAPKIVATVYLSLLNHPSNWESSSTESLGRLLNYARSFWPTQLRNIGELAVDDRPTIMLQKFIGSADQSGPAYRSWYRVYGKTLHEHRFSFRDILYTNFNLLNPSDSALLPVCLFGFEHIMVERCKVGKLDANQQNSIGSSLLALAIQGGKEAIVQLLLDKGADVNAQLGGYFGSALAAAVRQGNEAIVRLLLDKGADVNAQLGGSYGSALAAAAAYGSNVAIVRLLLENGADVNGRGGHYGIVPNTFAFHGLTDILRLLYEQHNVDRRLSDDQGRTPLHFAARGGKKETFDYLIGLGMDPTVKDAKGDTIIHYAASGRSLELLSELLDKDYVDYSQSLWWSPLHWACRAGSAEIIELLVEKGVTGGCVTTTQPDQQWTPYSIAVFHQNRSLLLASSDIDNSLLGSDGGHNKKLVDMQGTKHGGFCCNGCIHVGWMP